VTMFESAVKSAVASPNGWVASGDLRTIGNNVDARLNIDGIVPREYGAAITFPLQARPTGTLVGGANGTLQFSFVADFNQFPNPRPQTQTASVNQKAAVVNAFYWCNWMHDRLYGLGFTEAAGNFQQDNFSRGGFGNDAVLVDVQLGAAYEGGAFVTSAEGGSGPPRIQVGLSHTTD